MSLDATPAEATRHLAVLDDLAQCGTNLCRQLEQRAQAPDADHVALCQAFELVARGIRRAIILSCSLTRLRTQSPADEPTPAQPTPPQPQADRAPSAAPRHERYDRLDKVDTVDGLDTLDELDATPGRSIPDLIVEIVRDMTAAAATVQPNPPSLPTPTPILPFRHDPNPVPAARPRDRWRS